MLEKNTIFISLGGACQPAIHLRQNGLRKNAYPFDWINTSAKSLCLLLENDFQNFFDKEHIAEANIPYSGGKCYMNKRYNILFFHEFKDENDFKNNFEKVKEKYERRIKRFYEALHSGQPIFFIRHIMTRIETDELNNLIQNKFPNLKYNLLVIDSSEEVKQDWQMKNVFNRYMETARYDNATDPKYNNAWTNLFQTFIGEFQRPSQLPPETE